jgi:uncharacterized repeat protein (TIGR02543 family)
MKDYVTGPEKLTVYTDVPGHDVSVINGYASRAKSDIYEIRVRSAATDNDWVQCFANMTYNRGQEMPLMTDFQTPTATHAYQRFTAGWTHTYANIEMSENSPVEVEIRKIGNTTLDGSSVIVKSAVHPAHKIIAGSKKDENGRVYFKIDKPCQIVIDINGQMDDHNAAYASNVEGGRMPDGSPVHSIAFYANPIMAKPVASPSNTIVTVNPVDSSPVSRLTPPDSATYDTLVFAPGVHNVGPGFKVHPGKNYYIPGDAILYGNLTNYGVDQGDFRCNGDSIKIHGYGTICGVQIPHYQNTTHDDTATGTPNPEYPEWFALPEENRDGSVGIAIQNAWDVRITGVTTIDPANFNTKFDGYLQSVNDQSLVSWVKLHSWRVNGDGFGGYAPVEDSFFRTSDDSTYVRDWRRRCTFWKDTNANIFRFVNYKSGGLDDCDVIYARWRDTRGVGSVFEFADGGYDQAEVLDLNLTMRNIRFHDKHSNPSRLFSMDTLQSYRGLVFENISAYVPKNAYKSILIGSEIAPWYERLVFKNVTYKTSEQSQYDTGTLLTAANFNTYFETNEFVKYILFDHPRNLTLAITADPAKGFVTKNPNQATHVETTSVTLTATAEPGYVFTSWVGLNQDDPTTDPTANPMTIRMLDNRSITANFGLADIAEPVVITTPRTGSWLVPAGVYSATIQVWGGGGAGGSAEHTPGSTSVSVRGGGGTGGSFSSRTLLVSPAQIINYTVGAGGVGSTLGAGQTFPSDSNSGDGGASYSTVNAQNLVSAVGGLGGKNKSGSTTSVSGAGRTAPTSGNIGDSFYYGGSSAGGSANGTGGGGGSAGSQGNGGDAPDAPAAGIAGLGGGAAGAEGHNGTLNGNIGGFPGGCGSGAGVRNNGSGSSMIRIGGKGGNGSMVVTYNTMSFPLATQAVNGTINLSPTGGSYRSGATVQATAIPVPGYQFIGWSGALSGTVNPTSVLMDGDKSITANFAVTGPSPTEYRVNCGGPEYIALDGSVYAANTAANVYTTTQPIANTSDDILYQSERWSASLNYNIPLANDDYQVTLMFAEIFHNAANKRTFDVKLEGAPVITNLDIWSKVGKNAAYNETHLATVSDGVLNINFIKKTDNPKISAIRVIPAYVLSTSALNGSVTLDPPRGVYAHGAPVTLTALPDAGYRFAGWSGALTGVDISSTLVMDGNKSVTANFNSTADPFTAWAGAGVNFADDANNDGVAEGMAWFLGADQPNDRAADLLPNPTRNAGALVLEFNCLNATDRGTAIFEVQYNNDLGQIDAWTGTPIPGAAGTYTDGVVDFVVTDPNPASGLLKVVATIPAGEAAAGRIFGRIKGIK